MVEYWIMKNKDGRVKSRHFSVGTARRGKERAGNEYHIYQYNKEAHERGHSSAVYLTRMAHVWENRIE